jgi:hypothetical protein
MLGQEYIVDPQNFKRMEINRCKLVAWQRAKYMSSQEMHEGWTKIDPEWSSSPCLLSLE